MVLLQTTFLLHNPQDFLDFQIQLFDMFQRWEQNLMGTEMSEMLHPSYGITFEHYQLETFSTFKSSLECYLFQVQVQMNIMDTCTA